MQSVKFVGLDSEVHEIVPNGTYAKVKVPAESYLRETTKLSCGIHLEENDISLIDQAISLIAGKPEFVSQDSLAWILAYCAEYKRLLKDVIYDDSLDSIRIYPLTESIKESGNVIYISRLISAIRLINFVVNGVNPYLTSGSIPGIDGLVGDEDSDPTPYSPAFKIMALSHYVECGSFKGTMTRCHFSNTILSFSPPPGEVYTFHLNDHAKTIHSEELFTIQISDYNDRYYRNYGEDGRFAHPRTTPVAINMPFVTDFRGEAFGKQLTFEHESDKDVHLLSFMTIPVPHNWITHTWEYTDSGLTKFPVPSHKYIENDQDCLVISMPKPSMEGDYTRKLKIAASCFSFVDQGIDYIYSSKSFTKTDLSHFIKSNKITQKMKRLRICIEKIILGNCIYAVDTIHEFDSINYVAKFSKVHVFVSLSDKYNVAIAVCESSRGPVSIVSLNLDILDEIQSNPSVTTHSHPDASFHSLLEIISSSKSAYRIEENVRKVVEEVVMSSDLVEFKSRNSE